MVDDHGVGLFDAADEFLLVDRSHRRHLGQAAEDLAFRLHFIPQKVRHDDVERFAHGRVYSPGSFPPETLQDSPWTRPRKGPGGMTLKSCKATGCRIRPSEARASRPLLHSGRDARAPARDRLFVCDARSAASDAALREEDGTIDRERKCVVLTGGLGFRRFTKSG